MENSRRTDKFKNVKRYSLGKKAILGVIVALVLSIGLEGVAFNWRPLIRGNQNEAVTVSAIGNAEQQQKNNFKRLNESEPLSFELKLDGRGFNKLNLDIKTADKSPGTYQLFSGEKLIGTRRLNDGEKVINISPRISSIRLEIGAGNVGDQGIELSASTKSVYRFNLYRFLFCFLMLLFGFAVFIFKEEKYHSRFIFLLILSFGTLLSVVVPPMHTYDEKEHLYKAFSVSEGNLFFSNGDEISLPKGLTEMYDKVPVLDGAYYSYEEAKEYTAQYLTKESSKLERKEMNSTASSYLFVPYIFEAGGILVAKVLGLPALFYIWFARISNVIAYAVLLLFAARKMPRNKYLLLFFAAQPVLLYGGASAGFDSVMMGFLFLGLTTIYDVRMNRKKLKVSEFLVILFSFLFVLVSKVTYAPILLFFLLLKKENFSDKKQRIIYTSVIAVAMFVLALVTYSYGNSRGMDQWPIEGVDTSGQMRAIIQNPLGYLKVLIDYFSERTIDYTQNIFMSLGYLEPLNAFVALVDIGILVFLSIFDIRKSEQEIDSFYFSISEKLITYFSIICMIVLSATALYITFNPVGALGVNGFQPRYFWPIVLPFLMTLSSRKIQNSFNEQSIYYMTFYSILGINLSFMWVSVISSFII